MTSRATGTARCECGHLAKWHYVQPTGIITEERGCRGSTPDGNSRCRCPGFTRAVEDSRPTYDRDVLVSVLVYHARNGIEGCSCGWGSAGRSWPEHVVTIYEESLAARLSR